MLETLNSFKTLMSSPAVPPLATAHKNCASRDILKKSELFVPVPTKSKGVFVIYEYVRKEDFGKVYCGNHTFSESQ